MTASLTRRDWLTRNAGHTAAWLALAPPFRGPLPDGHAWGVPRHARLTDAAAQAARVAAHAERIDPAPWHALAQRAVDAARSAGATYADARLTRTVIHYYDMGGNGKLWLGFEHIGVGVRALVDGYWGYAAAPYLESEEIVQMARDAVAQATANAKGPSRTVELGTYPTVTGTWAMPVRVDPFTVTIEEKLDFLTYWRLQGKKSNVYYEENGIGSVACFVRQERVVGTSEGSLFTQTCFESGGDIKCYAYLGGNQPQGPSFTVPGLGMTGQGWELFLDADLPAQFPKLREKAMELASVGTKGATIGRYTLVCDGPTMASVLDQTLGVATQLDRALGYEANAGGTSFIDDPLAMVGTYQVASPLVTVTANRSMPTGLATVKWDDEGVVPADSPLIQKGVLVDFQTTREQAAWLAPYYQKQGRPVHSNGCAAAMDALTITMQQMPNLALEPSPSSIRLEDLVADVKDGVLLENCEASGVDFQARNGVITPAGYRGGEMREIKNGHIGKRLSGGAIWFDSQDFWQHLTALGGAATQGVIGPSFWLVMRGPELDWKGQPPQGVSHTVRAAAAIIPNQPIINPNKKA